LLAPGLQKTSVLLTARGTGPQLLAFLRRLEGLSLLVVQSDLQLSHGTANEKAASADTRTSLRLQLSLYSRD
jgi:type IV pilus assembly protein PilO